MLRRWFFVVTLLIAAVAWVIALVGQSLVAAQISNATIGPLWLAVVVQLFILLQLFSALSSSSLKTHTPLITSLLPISTVLAAIGIDNNLFPSSEPSSQKLTAAAWIITAVINCIWIIALTAGDGTRTRRFFDIIIGHDHSPEIRNGADPGVAYGYDVEYPPGDIPMTTSPRTSTGTGTHTAPKPQPQPQPSKPLFGLDFKPLSNRLRRRPRSQPPTALDLPNPNSPTPPPQDTAQIPTIPSVATHSEPYPHSPQQRDSSLYAAQRSEGNDSRTQRGSVAGGEAEGTRASSVTQPDGAAGKGGDHEQAQTVTATSSSPVPVRAQAMYSYTASTSDPTELSFKKGEILDIIDKSGKWWEAVKANGSKGIAPSNYLRPL